MWGEVTGVQTCLRVEAGRREGGLGTQPLRAGAGPGCKADKRHSTLRCGDKGRLCQKPAKCGRRQDGFFIVLSCGQRGRERCLSINVLLYLQTSALRSVLAADQRSCPCGRAPGGGRGPGRGHTWRARPSLPSQGFREGNGAAICVTAAKEKDQTDQKPREPFSRKYLMVLLTDTLSRGASHTPALLVVLLHNRSGWTLDCLVCQGGGERVTGGLTSVRLPSPVCVTLGASWPRTLSSAKEPQSPRSEAPSASGVGTSLHTPKPVRLA